MDSEDVESTLGWATSALELAKVVGDQELEITVRSIVALAGFLKGDPEARRQLELIRARAAEAGLDEHVSRADDRSSTVARNTGA
jgi:hypothetical protein